MTVPTLIFIALTTIVLIVTLWAIASAVAGDIEIKVHRLIMGCSAAALVVFTTVAALAAPLGCPRLVWATLLLPPLVLAVTWSNVEVVRGLPGLARVIALPVLVYDVLLVGIYSAAAAQECFGIELGTWGSSILAADAQLQRLIGHPSATVNPIWLHLPLVFPLWQGLHFLETLTLVLSSAVSCLLVFVFMMVMPLSFQRSESYTEAAPAMPQYTTELGLKVPWGEQLLSDYHRTRIREWLRELGANRVTIVVDSESFENIELKLQVHEEVRWARTRGIGVIVIAGLPQRFATIPASSLTELREAMTQAQVFAVQHLKPDVLVMFAGPFGRLRQAVAASVAKPTDWMREIGAAAKELRHASPLTKLAVSLETVDLRTQVLFRMLKAEESPVDIVGFSIFPRGRLLGGVVDDLERLGKWCERTPGNRPVMVFECDCPPRIHGGDTGQWNVFARAIAFADRVEDVVGVSLDSVFELRRDAGIVSWAGRGRKSYQKLVESVPLRRPSQPPAK